jgi:UTP-glucose-1-phosphate uridylyltransferase
MFTVKFYSGFGNVSEAFIREAETVQVRKVGAVKQVIIAGQTYDIGPSSDYQRAIVENAAGKTTQIIDERH